MGILKALWEDLLRRKRLVQEECPGNDRAYLLGSSPDRPMDPTVLSRKWIMLAPQNGLTGVWFHDLRHTYITRLVGAGATVKTVQALMGHSSAMTTLDVYTAVDPRDMRETVAQVEERIPC